MSQTRILLDLTFAGSSPLIAGDRLRTMSNIERLIRGLKHGSHQRAIGGAANTCKTTPTIVAASGTATCATVTTGQTVSIGGTALTAQQSRARATCTPNVAVAGNTLVLNGITFTAVAGAATLGVAEFSIDTSDAATATSLAAQVNAYVDPAINGRVTALVIAAGVVTFIALAEGTSGNSITLTATATRLAVTGSGFLAGGAAIANNKFDFGSGDTLVAASLARAINASTTAAIQQVTATSALGVVTMTAKLGGVGGNAITLTSSDGATLAVTGSGFLTSGSQGATTVLTF